jgi:acetylornithine deacetylase
MSFASEIDNWIDKKRDNILASLSELVQIKTLNLPPGGDEKPGQEFLYDKIVKFLPQKDIDVFEIDDVEGIREHPLFFPTIDGIQREYKGRPNIVAKLGSRGSGKSILFSGHMDIMPVKEEKWDVFEDPFSGKVKDAKMYGRGTADMKAGTLACFMALECLKDLNVDLAGDVYAESVVDEENGGVNGTIAARLRYPDIDFAILPEPSQMIAGIETRGGSDFKISIDEGGSGGIAFKEKPVNPIYKMSKTALAIEKYEKIRNDRVVFPEYFKHNKYLPIYTFQFSSGGSNYQESGSVPTKAHMYLWLETLAGMDAKKETDDFLNFLKDELKQYDDFSTGFPKLEQKIRFLQGHKTDLGHAGLGSIKKAHQILSLDYRPEPLNFACDAFAFAEVSGTQVVVLGPRGGNLHGKDEWVDINDFFDLIKIMSLTAIDYCK